MKSPRVLLTGMNGTVAPAVADALAGRGAQVLAWNRAEVPVDDENAMRAFLARVRPDHVLHAALGPPEWAGTLARLCLEQSAAFLFVSTVSVFSAPPNGPYAPGAEPNAEDDYGRYKRLCEQLVHAAHPGAAIVRIGWQIGSAPGSNNMVDWIEKEARQKGRVEANRNWIPSCSFLEDTATAFAAFLEEPRGGIHHVEGNGTGIPFNVLVHGLNELHGHRWTVVDADGPTFDNRLAHSLPGVTPVAERVSGPAHPGGNSR